MPAPTTEEMLEEVRLAILAIVKGGQSYVMYGSRQVTKANLRELLKYESQLEKRLHRETTGYNGVNTADFSEV